MGHRTSPLPGVPGPRYFNPITFLRSLPDPTDQMLAWQREYGDTYEVPSVFGPIVVTGDPEEVRALFTADADTFVPYQPGAVSPFLGETSLTLVSGARHRRDRKLLSPPFNGARMRAYGAIMSESAERAAAAWAPGRPFEMLDTTQSISLEVILRAVFGLEHAAARAQVVKEAVGQFTGAIRPQFLFLPQLRFDLFGLTAWARFKRARDHLDTLLYAEIAERRRGATAGEDILSLMMSARYEDGGSMSDTELRDELLTLLFAGHETTAIALAWAFYWLHREPGELDRVLAELATLGPSADADAIAALPYLDAVCQETLRLRPVVAEIPRTLVKPLRMGKWDLPAGKAVMASVIMVHHREGLYPEPTRFRPSRFLERKLTPFEHIPFGGGARRCIGSAFALYEMKLVLASLLRARRLRLVSSAPVKPRRRGLTLGPTGGIPMLYEGPRTT